ncbi:F0F1 ATP synthase subunit A [Candidatus Parcubacteria bacterium]|nr:F0F1 ATP synthase subunit A [Patescibacteria group bacterium]MBU4453353.1 F0F1 ATP synthase subunit A [Patescibacteria group bacterium]MCG2694042.1 F0F1 ATP synthase subunit A [Candidatus Parcubacteria bacterium]
MHISLAAEPMFKLGSFTVTNTLIMSVLISVGLIILALILRKKMQEKPKGFQNLIELLVEKLLNFMETVTQDRRQAVKFFPLVATIFVFVILSNWLEIVPGLGTIGLKETIHGEQIIVPFIRSSSADLNMTMAIAVISVIATQIFGIMAIGFFKHWGKFISFKGPIEFFVGILELISEVAKMISFSFRLFGNIFAGEVLLTVVLFLVPYIVPLPFLFLEIFVGFVQALVFSMLTLVFLKMATVSHEH